MQRLGATVVFTRTALRIARHATLAALLALAGCTLGGGSGDEAGPPDDDGGIDPCEDCDPDDGGPPAPPVGDGTTVAVLETIQPHTPTFILSGTFPVAPGTFPRPDGRDPFTMLDYDGTPLITQTEIVSRYANDADGADVVEVLAKVRMDPSIPTGQQVRYDVVQSPYPAVLPPGTLGLEDLNATEQVPSPVQGLLLNPNGIEIRAVDCFGNDYVCRPLDHTGNYRLMRRGRVRSEMRIYQTMVPEPAVSGPQGTLPHLFGVHSYVSTLKGHEILGLDLRFNNGHCGRDPTTTLDNPLNKVYFERIEVSLPQEWFLQQDHADPYFGEPMLIGGRRVYQLVKPLPNGKMHVMRWQGQFHRRLMISTAEDHPIARYYLNGYGHAFCVRGNAAIGGNELWSWWNRGTARYFPQKSQLPALDHVGMGLIRSQLAGTFNWVRGHLENGTCDGVYPIQEVNLGWGHPYGVSYGGMTGGSEIFCWDGITVAASASVSGYRLYQVQHRMHTDRHPTAFYERDGEPTSVERWLVDGPGSNDYVPFYHFLTPFLGSSYPDPFGYNGAPLFQSNFVAANGMKPGYESLHLQYDPHDFQHLVRYTRSAKVLAWLGNDSLAKDDLRMQAENFHLSFHPFFNDPYGGYIGSGMRAMRGVVNAHPGTGFGFGRGEAWGLDCAVAAFATSDAAWRVRKRTWFEDVTVLLLEGQGACNGFIQSFVSEKAVGGRYRARQLIEQSITEHALVGLRETVFRGFDAAYADMVRDILVDSLYAFIGGMSWFPNQSGPWRYTGIGPLNPSLPVWCSASQMPSDAWSAGDIEAFQDWSSFAYGYELTGDSLFLEFALRQIGGTDLLNRLRSDGLENIENRAPLLALAQHLAGVL
jgi:hypothetical protein